MTNRTSRPPLSQVEIEGDILTDLDDMEKATEDLEGLLVDAARAEVEFKTAQAASYLRSTGSIKQREAQAMFSCEKLHLEYKIAEARGKYGREVLQTLRARLDGHRSLNSNLRPLVTN